MGTAGSRLSALLRTVLTETHPPALPADLQADSDFAQLYMDLLELRRFILAVAGENLDTRTTLKGYTAGALKTLQANFRHMTWQTQQVAAGNFNQRIEFMGDFSAAYNEMVAQLAAAQKDRDLSLYRLKKSNKILRKEIMQRSAAQAALAEQTIFYRALTETMLDVVWVVDTKTLLFTYISPSVERLRGFTPEEIMQTSVRDILPPDKRDKILAKIAQNRELFEQGQLTSDQFQTIEMLQPAKDGSAIWTEVVMHYVRNGVTGAVELCGVARDISDRKALQQELERRATLDCLTGVANRGHFLRLAQEECKRSQRYQHPLSLLILDLDHFKAVNDSFGHAVGDMALQAMVQTCLRELRNSDLMGRIGGEEFAILLPQTAFEQSLATAQRLRQQVALIELTTPAGQPIALTTSIGLSTFRHGETCVAAMMERADLALYQAKNKGRNRVEFLP